MKCYIGLMSGTSMDGIDAALVDVEQNSLVMGKTCQFSPQSKQLLEQVCSGENVLPKNIAVLNRLIGLDFAKSAIALIEQTGISPKEVVAIGSHGQTITHDAIATIPYTFQLGCPHTIAVNTGIQVVADFRSRDIALGGRGAPLAPLYHEVLFSQAEENIAVLNIGGLANITFLESGKAMLGFDTGPGNCLMDYWCKLNLKRSFDENGAWASTGKSNRELLSEMMQDSYFSLKAPKSLGKEYFIDSGWLEQFNLNTLNAVDIQSTLMAFTIASITHAIEQSSFNPQKLYVCGGGAKNELLFHQLKDALPMLDVFKTSEINVDPDYLEAMMMAWLAKKAIAAEPIDTRHITGASKPSVLGVVYRA